MDLTDLFANIAAFVRNLSDPVPKAELLDAPRGRASKVVAVRNDYSIETLTGPDRSQRKHKFHELRSFAEWLNRFGKAKETEILVGDKEASAVVSADVAASSVTCELRAHPTYDAWQAAFGKPLAPKALFAFVRSVQDTFKPIGAGDGPNAGDVLAGELQKLKAVTTGDIEMSVDPRGFYAVQGATQKVQVDAKLPPQFSISTPIYVGVPEILGERGPEKLYPLPILLSMDVSEKDGILITLTCPSLKRVLHDARLDAVEHLRRMLDPDFLVGLGDLKSDVFPG